MRSVTSSQVFLNEPTIESAREAYLSRWHLPSVQASWAHLNGRKPTLNQFKAQFGSAYSKRQAWLAKQDGTKGGTAVALDERDDVVQAVAERLLELMGGTKVEVENLGQAEDIDVTVEEKPASVLDRLKAKRTVVEVEAEADTEVAEVVEPKFVKAENFDELPRSGQLYFFLHRAVEAGQSYAIVPLKRGVAAECISQIKDDGRTYQAVAAALVK